MLNVFLGYDPRQPLAYNVCQHSIIRHASEPIAITPLVLNQMPVKRRGLTEFTYSRFLVPWLCNYQGRALFMDADIAVAGDVSELFRELGHGFSAAVMQNQERFEWASVIFFNCFNCRALSPSYVANDKNAMFDMKWADHGLGELPPEWNHCVHYMQPKKAKLYHYTAGLPCWPETRNTEEAEVWGAEFLEAFSTCSWQELMGNSVHAKLIEEAAC